MRIRVCPSCGCSSAVEFLLAKQNPSWQTRVMATAGPKTKVCGRCRKRRRIAKFHRRCGGGYQSYCRDCDSAYRKERRQKSEKYRANNWRASVNARRVLLDEICTLKESRPCTDCKKKHPHWRMQFDHVRGTKVRNVSDFANRGARDLAYKEIKKCELVCANCHADRTHTRKQHAVVAQQ